METFRKCMAFSALIASLGFAGFRSGEEARCGGSFPLAFRPVPVTLDSLERIFARVGAPGTRGYAGRVIRVSALIGDSLSVTDLNRYGWRIVSRLGKIATLEGSAESAPYLGALPGIRYIKMPSRVYFVMDSARRNTYVDQLQKTKPGWSGPKLTGKHVLYGLIDTDFDTHHKAFQDSTGATRFVAVWDQMDSTKKYPNRFGYGSIANHKQLLTDSLFSLAQGFHGTCMASYAAGSQLSCPYYGVAPDAMIVGVKMDTTDQGIIDGLSWIFAMADSLKLPCVVSMSLGSPDGPHDGTSLVDQVIDSVSAKPGHIVVGAAGNDGDKRAHVPLTVAAGQTAGTWISSYPDNGYYYYGIEMWGTAGQTFTVTFNVLDTAAMVYKKSVDVLSTAATGSYKQTSVIWTDSTTRKPDTITFYGLMTEHASALNGKPHLQAFMATSNPRLHLGVTVTVAGTSGGTVQAWSLFQNAFQSYQIAGFIGGDSTMSVNELGGTAKDNITVGAYMDHLLLTLYTGAVTGADDFGYHTFAHYTGRGPTADGRIKPDLMAPGSQVVGAMARDMPASEFQIAWWPDYPLLDQRYAITGGTSCAAPIVAGVVAMMLQADSAVTFSQARTLLQETARTDSATGIITTPNNLWGAGKADALGALGKLLNISATRPVAGAGNRATQALVKLPGNRLHFTGALLSKDDRITFEYFSIDGRLSRRVLSAVGETIDSYGMLPHGIYLARVREGNRTLSETTVTLVSRE
jgi:hypothetical protein